MNESQKEFDAKFVRIWNRILQNVPRMAVGMVQARQNLIYKLLKEEFYNDTEKTI